jgi:DNA-binding transcriptional ArsR family regulator
MGCGDGCVGARRRHILRIVWSEELQATEITVRVGEIPRSAGSQHLAVLKGANLVVKRRDGARRLYRSNHQEMAPGPLLDEGWAWAGRGLGGARVGSGLDQGWIRVGSGLDQGWITGLDRQGEDFEIHD